MINGINLFDLNSDRLGCYYIDNQKYFSRLETARIHHDTGKFPTWWFHDDAFSSVDWTVEPSQSLEQLYRQRAEQLRDNYDYLILCFSGGADSQNVLDTFLTNGIFLDEIMIYHNLSKEQGYSFDQLNDMNAEVVKTAIPVAQEFVKASPKTQLRSIDFSDLQYQYFLSEQNIEKFIWSVNSLLSPNTGILAHKWTLSSDYIDLISQGKRVCFITGHEKPRVEFDDSRYSVKFYNLLDSVSFVGSSAPNEPFYWTPDFPKLIVKQAHVLKHHVESESIPHSSLKNCSSRQNSVFNVLYPAWDHKTFQRPKGRPAYSSRDRWFFSLPDSDPAKANWVRAVKTYWDQLPEYWKNDPKDLDQGTKLSVSTQYFLD